MPKSVSRRTHSPKTVAERLGWKAGSLRKRAALVGGPIVLLLAGSDIVYRLVRVRTTSDLVSIRLLSESAGQLQELTTVVPEIRDLRPSLSPQVFLLPESRRSDVLAYLDSMQSNGQLAFDQLKEQVMHPLVVLGDQQLSKGMIEIAQLLEADPLIEEVTFAKARGRSLYGLFEPSLVGAKESLALPITPTEVVLAKLESLDRVGRGGLISRWRGGSATTLGETGETASRVSLSEFDDAAYGFVEHEGATYEIRPLAEGGYVIVRANPANDPGSATTFLEAGDRLEEGAGTTDFDVGRVDGRAGTGEQGFGESRSERRRGYPPLGILAALPPATAAGPPPPQLPEDVVHIGLVVVYTLDAVKGYKDYIPSMVDDAVGSARRALITENGPRIELDLNCVQRFDQTSKQDLTRDLALLVGDGDGFLDEVHELRRRNNGDLVVLVTGQSGLGGSRCGLARRIFAERPEDGFAVVRRDCARILDSLIHELGHLFGAAHDNHQNAQTLYRPYGRGAVFGPSDRRFRTLMTSHRSCGNCQRLELWSSLNDWDGLVTGSDTANNLRVILETAPHIAALVPEPAEGDYLCDH